MQMHLPHAIITRSILFVVLSAKILVAQQPLTPHQVNELFPSMSLDSCLAIIDERILNSSAHEHGSWIAMKGRLYLYHNQYESAKGNLEEWLRILGSNEAGDSILAEAYNYLGLCYDELHLNHSSERALITALKHAHLVDDSTDLISMIYTNLVYLYSYSHQLKPALAYSKKVLQCDRETFGEYDNYVHADYVNLARIYHLLNNFRAENDALLNALHIQKSGKAKLRTRDEIGLLEGLSRNYLALEMFDSALFYAKQKVELEGMANNTTFESIRSELLISEVFLRSNQVKNAREALLSAKNLARIRTTDFDPIWAEIYFQQGKIDEKLKPLSAIQAFRKVLKFPFTLEDGVTSADHLNLLLKTTSSLTELLVESDLDETIEILEQTVDDLINSIFDATRLSAIAHLGGNHESIFTTLCFALQKRYAMQGQMDDLDLLHLTLSRWKLLTGLEDIFNHTLIDEGGPATEDLTRMLQQKANIDSRLKHLRASSHSVDPDSIKILEITQYDLQISIRNQLAEFEGGVGNLMKEWMEIPSLSEISQWSSNTGWSLVNYLVQREKILTLIISPSGITAQAWQIPTNTSIVIDEIIQNINDYPSRQFRDEQIVEKDITDYKEAAYQLYRSLWEPFEHLVTERVIIVGDPILEGVPFGALVMEPDFNGNKWVKSEFMADRYILSWQNWMQKSTFNEMAPGIKDVHVVTPFANRDEPNWSLPGTDDQYKMILKTFHNAESVQGSSISIFDTQTDLIHFATHAIFEESDNALYLLTDTIPEHIDCRLYLDQIYTWVHTAKVVILDACTTGSTKAIGGTQRSDLGKAFMTAGASNVISTQWDISDESSPFIMSGFYNNIQNEASLPVALNQAVRSYLAQSSGHLLHPYHWASWRIWSSGNKVVLDRKPEHFLRTGLGILLLLVLMGLIKKRVVR